MKNVLIGAHLSIAGGFAKAIERAESIGATALQIFSKSARSLFAKPLDKKAVKEFKTSQKASSVKIIAIHTSYLINLASPNSKTETNSINSLLEELKRCEALGAQYLVLHPGSHLGSGIETGIKKIAKNINKVLKKHSGKAKILLETMAGQGTNIGSTFEEIRQIYNLIDDKKRIGVCLDTCHIFSAGYDLNSAEGYAKTMKQFTRIVGISRLKLIHINDSLTSFDSHKDRHTNIGKGNISPAAFKALMNDPKLTKIAKILETPAPEGLDTYKKEIYNLTRM
ncbi:deoxyribonuclease IV [Candidatus Babeliales bacterium]|nr:deoxyribonuclease IV [Candidatus Babeliales bacterium]